MYMINKFIHSYINYHTYIEWKIRMYVCMGAINVVSDSITPKYEDNFIGILITHHIWL